MNTPTAVDPETESLAVDPVPPVCLGAEAVQDLDGEGVTKASPSREVAGEVQVPAAEEASPEAAPVPAVAGGAPAPAPVPGGCSVMDENWEAAYDQCYWFGETWKETQDADKPWPHGIKRHQDKL